MTAPEIFFDVMITAASLATIMDVRRLARRVQTLETPPVRKWSSADIAELHDFADELFNGASEESAPARPVSSGDSHGS